jgi:hypothetical protein
MKYLIVALAFAVALSNLACGSGGGSALSAPSLAPVVGPISVTITLKSGRDFECFVLDRAVYCRGFSANNDIGLASASFAPYVTDANTPIIALELWDDTICWSVFVSERPYSRTPGSAVYCIGEATLAGSYSGFPIIYSGPNFVSATNGSNDLTYAREPFMGGDITMTDHLNSTYMTDGRSLSSVQSLSCSLLSGTLTCPTFSTGVL